MRPEGSCSGVIYCTTWTDSKQQPAIPPTFHIPLSVCVVTRWSFLGPKEFHVRGSKWVCFPSPVSMSYGPWGLERFLESSLGWLLWVGSFLKANLPMGWLSLNGLSAPNLTLLSRASHPSTGRSSGTWVGEPLFL